MVRAGGGRLHHLGLVPNPRLEAIAEPPLARAERESGERGGEKARLVADAPYEAGSRGRTRRVVYEAAEATQKGTNTRFVVTGRRGETPEGLHDWYVGRGEVEGWIKDFERASKSDRLSRTRFRANRFRLLLHAAAYWLPDALRGKLVAAGARRMRLDTLRLRLVKVGGRVRQLLTAVRMHLASSHPGQRLWRLLDESRRRARE